MLLPNTICHTVWCISWVRELFSPVQLYPYTCLLTQHAVVICTACLTTWIARIVSPLFTIKSTFTPSRVALAGTVHYYSCSRAKEQLGYVYLVFISMVPLDIHLWLFYLLLSVEGMLHW